MDPLTRRKFLLASGVLGAAALVDGAASVSWRTLLDRARTDPAPVGQRTVVVLTLYGGNDGLATVVPYADDAYQSARHDLAYSPSEVIKLDDQVGFNPAMTGLKSLWDDKRLAVVQGVGYPKPQFSHFASMDIWQSGSPDVPLRSGWVGRYLDAYGGGDPVHAIAVGSVLPPMAVGEQTIAGSLASDKYVALDSDQTSFLRALTAPGQATGAGQQVLTSIRSEHDISAAVGSLMAKNKPDDSSSSLDRQLDVVSKAITAGVPTRVWMTSTGGFDLHSGERDTQEGLWKDVDASISRFFKSLKGTPRGDDVVMMVHSEFGRRVAANAADGTDHGSAAPVFVIGSAVNGGFHGQAPSLTDLDAGDLRYTVDFRAVYGELLDAGLGVDPSRVLSTVPASLGVLKR